MTDAKPEIKIGDIVEIINVNGLTNDKRVGWRTKIRDIVKSVNSKDELQIIYKIDLVNCPDNCSSDWWYVSELKRIGTCCDDARRDFAKDLIVSICDLYHELGKVKVFSVSQDVVCDMCEELVLKKIKDKLKELSQ
ncbi:MAG: hypothetical protein WC307_07045 [Candidatus Nanoarchaeia archaeon]|jgi:hypothetical protein